MKKKKFVSLCSASLAIELLKQMHIQYFYDSIKSISLSLARQMTGPCETESLLNFNETEAK